MEIQARLTHEKLNHSQDNNVQLVVSLKAPQLDWVAKRPSICVLPVIDLSGSMKGEKLEYAKRSLDKLVDQLQPDDVIGLIGFESRIHKLMEPQLATAEIKAKLKNIISRLTDMGGTDLAGGFLEAVRSVESLDLSPRYIKRVILFTDGEPNHGITDKSQILRLLKENLGSVTVSAFGYGGGSGMHSACDQDFLTKFAQEGKGNYAYVRDPDDALTAFGRELGGLLSTYAQNIQVDVEPLNGHQITRVLSNIPITQNALGEVAFKISDILSEETRHFVFDVKMIQGKAGPRAVNVFQVRTSYGMITSSGKRETKFLETKVKVQFVAESEAQKEPHKELDEVVALAQVVRAQIEAEEQAKKGQFEQAQKIMADTAQGLTNRGLHNTARVATNIQHRVTSGLYAQSSGYLSSMSVGGTRAYGLSSMDADAQADLSFCNVALGNSSMNQTMTAFSGAVASLIPPPPVFVASKWQYIPTHTGVDLTPPEPVIDLTPPKSMITPISLENEVIAMEPVVGIDTVNRPDSDMK